LSAEKAGVKAHISVLEAFMAAILPILIFVIAIAAINLAEFHRVD
jgi:hypothetical protein